VYELCESLQSGSLLINVNLFSLISGKSHSVNRDCAGCENVCSVCLW
jgi:hypothetical protein